MNQNNFLWLLNWYQDHCNGDWEHGRGIHIESIDNPGWSLTINLENTELENKNFHEIMLEKSTDDWFICFMKNKNFEGRCGPSNFLQVLQIFRDWAEGSEDCSE